MDKASPQLLVAAGRGPAPQDAVLRCQAALLARSALTEAATALAAELAEVLQCRRVSVGLLEAGRIRVVGSSQSADLDPRQDAAAQLAAAMHESLDQHLSLAWPPLPGIDAVTLALSQLAGMGQACAIPLVAAGETLGAIALERGPEPPFTAADLATCEDVASFAAPVLAMKRDAALPWTTRARRSLQVYLATPDRRRKAWITGAVVALAVLAVPLPWRVSAPARLEGAVQRAVVAASDGFLQQVNVRPGDRVTAGQLLGQLSSQDLELERRRRESEMRQHENAYRAAEARNERTQMVVSQSRAAEAQALLALAETQLQRSQLVAPFDGVVIKGDLTQNLGAPVKKGEVLMVLAPSDNFRLIVEVDETDIAAVRAGQHGSLALAARPEQSLSFTTRRIVPLATAADGRNYFEVEASLDSPQPDLRPGLSGVAKIEAGHRPLAWLLFHRPIAWARLALWTLGP
jgi:biotin carboxyl carrier protein